MNPPTKDWCYEFFVANLEDTFQLVQAADYLEVNSLLTNAQSFIDDHYMEIMETKAFRGLPPDKFGALIARDNLNVPNEETVFESLVSWMSEDPEERSKSLQNLVPHIRAHLLPGPFVDETMKTFLVKNNNSDLCHQLNYENKTPRNGFEQCIVAIQAKD